MRLCRWLCALLLVATGSGCCTTGPIFSTSRPNVIVIRALAGYFPCLSDFEDELLEEGVCPTVVHPDAHQKITERILAAKNNGRLEGPLVIVAHPVRRDGWFPQSLAGFDQMGPAFAEAMKQSPIYEAYARVAPRVEDWPVLVDKMGTLLRQDYDWSAEVDKITAPVMLVYGDADSVWPAHIAEFYALLGGGLRDANWDGSARPLARLAILPGHTHYDIFFSPDLPHAVIPFLDAASLDAPAPMGQ